MSPPKVRGAEPAGAPTTATTETDTAAKQHDQTNGTPVASLAAARERRSLRAALAHLCRAGCSACWIAPGYCSCRERSS